jgi:hypothetical protein
MKRNLSVLFVGLLISAMTCSSAWAQATAQISGAVQDQSGAVLPGAEITATQTETGVSRMTISNETGYYVLPNLPLGPYRLEVALPGFRTFVQTGIVLQVSANPTINVTLQVGQVSEQVEVQANASLVETRSLSVGQVMETARIMELPLNGRNAQELLLLNGGAVQTAPDGGMSYPSGRLLLSSAGAKGTSGELTLDGISHISPYDAYPLPLPFPDALSEFKTEIGGQSAQQARGSQASAVTKSGTNDFHGDLFEFVRNDLFNARPYFSTTSGSLKRNQFGGTLGGAIVKNKLFFFGGYQGTTIRQDATDNRQFVPTPAMLAGDFTTFASPACNSGKAVTLKAPFVGNKVDPALFSPIALKVVSRIPSSNDPCGEIHFGAPMVENHGQYIGKIDYQMNDRHSLFGRDMYSRISGPSPFKFTPDNPLNAGNDVNARAHAFTVGSTYLLSPTVVNAFRIGFTRTSLLTISPPYFDLAELGSKVYSGFTPKIAKLTITSGFSLPGNGRRFIPTDLYQISDDISVSRGTHQFGFGGRIAEARTNVSVQTSAPPTFGFNGNYSGVGLGDFLLGKPSDLTQAEGTFIYTRAKYFSLYGLDTWQMKPRLSLSYGLRFSPILAHQDVRRPVPSVVLFDQEKYRRGIRSTVFTKAPPGITWPGDPGFGLDNNGADAEKPHASLFNTYWKALSPRVGFAWDIEGNGRTSLRASYGLSYDDQPTVDRLGTQGSMAPYGSLTRVLNPAGGLEDPWRDVPGGNPFPITASKTTPFVPFGEYVFRNPDLTPTYTQTWNFSLQREVIKDTVMSVSYIGSEITHLQSAVALNQAVYVPGVGNASGNCFLSGQPTHFKVTPGADCSTLANTQDRRILSFLNPAFKDEIGRLAFVDNGGTQNYHGMIASIQRRPSKGVNVNANYTLSHCIGDYQARSNNGYGPSVDHTYQDRNDRRRDRGNCEIDQRHTFNLTGIVESPQFANNTLRVIGSGWRLSGIYRRSTGGTIIAASQALGLRTVTLGAQAGNKLSASGGDLCLCDISNQRPNQLMEDVYLDKSGRPGTQYLNPAAFGLPAVGTLGNMGRTTLVLPVSWQFDLSLARLFRIRENQNIEFRAEAYNVLNSFRTGAIETNLSSAQFGKIRNAQDPRILQFALKYAF